MKIVILGGGPAGLYFALLMKQRQPSDDIVVFERNPEGNTFGWGVVFSDQTLSYLAEPDPETFRRLERGLVTWENVDVVHRGEKVSIGGNRFAGIARIDLLRILQERCRELGVELQFEVEIDDLSSLPEADLLIGADGVNSRTRETYADGFGPSLDVRRNRYVWYGTPRLFHGLTLTFRDNDDGLFIAHSYKFSDSLSTFIVECDDATFEAAGLGAMEEEAYRAYLERVFAADLAGEPLLPNKSIWIRFITVRNRRWWLGADEAGGRPVVLLGDAAHTAHFSIGSGTKLALEDSIALAGAFERTGTGDAAAIEAALDAFEKKRRPSVERLQEAAQSSLEWFEEAAADLTLDPLPFALHVMTRSDRIDRENLRQRDPAFVAAVEAWERGQR